jgi:hypothetical protein
MTQEQLDALKPGDMIRERQAGSTVKQVLGVEPAENGFVTATTGMRETRVRKATLRKRFEIRESA